MSRPEMDHSGKEDPPCDPVTDHCCGAGHASASTAAVYGTLKHLSCSNTRRASTFQRLFAAKGVQRAVPCCSRPAAVAIADLDFHPSDAAQASKLRSRRPGSPSARVCRSRQSAHIRAYSAPPAPQAAMYARVDWSRWRGRGVRAYSAFQRVQRRPWSSRGGGGRTGVLVASPCRHCRRCACERLRRSSELIFCSVPPCDKAARRSQRR